MRVTRIKPWFAFLVIVVFLALINHRVGSTYVGLDNISPFWGIGPIQSQIAHAKDFFTFGPILFSWWFFLLNAVGLSASTISFLYVYGYMFIALLGYYELIRHFVKKDVPSWLFGLIFFSSLIPLWVFVTHELMFMSLFASLPWIYLLLTNDEISRQKVFFLFSLLFTIPMFFSSASNLAVFASGFTALVVLSAVNREFNSRFFLKLCALGIAFLALVQLLILPTRGRAFITAELQQHASILSDSSVMQQITVDLQKSELQNASLTNAARFATGWLALFDENKNYVLPWAITYRKNIPLVIVQIMVILSAILFPLFNRAYGKSKGWSYLYIVGAMLLSAFGLSVINNVPYLSILWRSASTKLWMLVFIPYLVLITELVSYLLTQRWWLRHLLFLLLLVPAFPWFLGKASGDFNAPIIPVEYEVFYQSLPANSSLVVLPTPQVVYFRKYDWGYYGSSLVSFMTKAKVLDGGSIGLSSLEYSGYIDKIDNCHPDVPLNKELHIVIEGSHALQICDTLASQFTCEKKTYFSDCSPNQRER